MESVYKTIIVRKPVNSGFLYGPFCPMYGIGAVIMLLASKISNNILIIFLMAVTIFTVWEYVVAVVLEKLFKTKYWDYSNIRFNFQGRICLKNSIYWGILGVILVLIIQPCIEKLLNLIPDNILLYINIVLSIAILVDTSITIFKIMFIDKKIRQVFELGDMIKEKVSELKNTEGIEKIYKENLQKIVKELKEKQELLKFKTYKRILRLKKAFPEMHSENLAKFMKQKISLETIKEKIKKHKEK